MPQEECMHGPREYHHEYTLPALQHIMPHSFQIIVTLDLSYLKKLTFMNSLVKLYIGTYD
jgi:hypothetical protein